MTKTELLADLAGRFTLVVQVEPHAQNSQGLSTKRYLTVVLETKTVDGVPVGLQRQINFYVINEGAENEQAFYEGGVPVAMIQ